MNQDLYVRVVGAIRATAQHPIPDTIQKTDSLIYDLGFDSMGIAMLSIGLEDQFLFPILLDSWISSHDGPQALTVDSLCTFVAGLVDDGTSLSPA